MTFIIRPWSALGALAVLAVSATTPAFAAAPVTTASGLVYESLKDLSLIHISEPTRPY